MSYKGVPVEATYTYAMELEGVSVRCWLAQFSSKERACYGRMDRAHLIEKQTLKREKLHHLLSDPRVWVPACRFHHTKFDGFTGVSVPREALSFELEELARENGLGWYLDRRYGALEAAA